MEKDKVYWTMKDGTKIDVDDMTIEHLRNTLKMIIRKREKLEDDNWYDNDWYDDPW